MSGEKKPDPPDIPEIRRVRLPSPPEGAARSTRRRWISGVLVAVDAPDVSDKPWVVDAVRRRLAMVRVSGCWGTDPAVRNGRVQAEPQLT